MLAWFHEGIYRLGDSITYAKQYLVDTAPAGKYLDLLDTFLLLGDPALLVKATQDACLTPTGVSMAGFTALQEGRAIRLTWETADETEILGFNVLRRQSDALGGGDAIYRAVNPETIMAVQAGVNAGERYAFLDVNTDWGRMYQYRLEIVKLDGTREQFGFAELALDRPGVYLPLLSQ